MSCELANAVKTCTRCGESKPLDAFGPRKRSPDGRHWWCRACCAADARAWRERNPTKAKSSEKRYRTANRNAAAARRRRFRAANPLVARAADKRRRAANPQKFRVEHQRWRARLRGAPGRGVSRREWSAIVEESDGRCAYCGRRLDLTMDHVDPLARGGAHEPENVVAACIACNTSKGDRTLLLWLRRSLLTRAATNRAA